MSDLQRKYYKAINSTITVNIEIATELMEQSKSLISSINKIEKSKDKKLPTESLDDLKDNVSKISESVDKVLKQTKKLMEVRDKGLL